MAISKGVNSTQIQGYTTGPMKEIVNEASKTKKPQSMDQGPIKADMRNMHLSDFSMTSDFQGYISRVIYKTIPYNCCVCGISRLAI